MDVLDSVPKHVLGYEIKTRTKIIFTFLLPASLELVAYLIQTLADIGVTIQHFRDKDIQYAWLTLGLIILPAIVTFVAIVTSPWQWPESEGCNAENVKFFFRLLLNMILFPVGAIFRFCRRIFWSVEALFHEKDEYEREHSVMKAAETSPFELYRFVQAYTQAAPQVILQLFILLRKDIFRNYETTNVQVLSVVFALVNIAVITMSYQRFESQKIVGRHYPWSTKQYVQHCKRKFQRTRSLTEELRQSKKRSAQNSRLFPETEHIMQRFHSQQRTSEPNNSPDYATDKNNGSRPGTSRASILTEENLNASQKGNTFASLHLDQKPEILGVDELDIGRRRSIPESDWSTIESADETNLELRSELSARQLRIQSMGSDYVPDIPPPAPPITPATGTSKRQSFNPLNRLSQFTDMLVLNAEIYIKDHVPRPPRLLIERALSQEERDKGSQPKKDNTNDFIRGSYSSQMTNPKPETSPRTTSAPAGGAGPSTGVGADELDFFLPTRKKMIEGVEQDNFAGKFVSFFGWILFIFMRMISLSVFFVFYPVEFVYLIGAHYVLMLLCLAFESRLKDKCERILFYFGLAYIYIFVILEFKIKFRHVRQMYIGYFLLVLLENFIITIVWYGTGEFSSWCFEFLYVASLFSGGLTLLCMIVYYCILRPNDLILFEDTLED